MSDLQRDHHSFDVEPIVRLHLVVHQGPVLKARNPIARIVRSAAFRFMRPFIAYQQQVNVATVVSVEALQERMTSYQVDLAMTLAELRRVERAATQQSSAD